MSYAGAKRRASGASGNHSASNEHRGTDLLHDELCHQVRKAGEGAVNHLKGIEAYQVI